MSLNNFKKRVVLFVIIFLLQSLLCLYPQKTCAISVKELLNSHASKAKIKSVKYTIENKRERTKEKIRELKKREKLEVNKLYDRQQDLEKAEFELSKIEKDYQVIKNKLIYLQTNLTKAQLDCKRQEAKASQRIRKIYKGERVRLLYLVLSSKDINMFLDRLYFQKKLTKYDKKVLEELRLKTRKIDMLTNQVKAEQSKILANLNKIDAKKRYISDSINDSQYLINKLRTDRRAFEQSEQDLAKQSEMLTKMLVGRIKKDTKQVKAFGAFLRPLQGVITSPFGWRIHPIFKSRIFHSGIDIAGPHGTPIKAANSGEVIFAGWLGGYGKAIIISHGTYKGKSISTLYGHLSKISVGVGSKVTRGQIIGKEGSTGYSTGPHLHFEVRVNGVPTNPLKHL